MSCIKEYRHDYELTGADCNPQRELPITQVFARVIDVATEHANEWGVGYANLIQDDHAWVLSKLAVEMKRYPKVNEQYSFITWIEGYNKLFSQRNMEIIDSEGETIGYVRSIWVAINVNTRVLVDISKLSYISENKSDRPCPIKPVGRLGAVNDADRSFEYHFLYSDCDINRHVTTTRYIALMLNAWSMQHFDEYFVKRFEISFLKECTYDLTATFNFKEEMPEVVCAEVVSNGDDGKAVTHCRARIEFEKRN